MDGWRRLCPRFEWRPSQRHLLHLASHVRDRRWHLCAPPGSGKTLIGLEIARQVGRPTLVLAPTTSIRDQWRQATAMFGADPATFTSAEPGTPAPLVAVTYQLLGNPGVASDELMRAARRLWVAEVAVDFGEGDGEARVAAVEASDPDRGRREVGRRLRLLRRSLSTDAPLGVPRESLLGERTIRLVEHFASTGIGCVVLDECHHLLDWWALVVAALVERLAAETEVAVVGLTATLPDPTSSREAGNYRGLLGDVDAELHLAAMVAEGAVAPWRDGVRLTALTPTELAFLESWSDSFEGELDDHFTGEAFVGWAVAQVCRPALDARAAADASLLGGETIVSGPSGWDSFWDRDPVAAAALARWWAARGLALPAGFAPPPGTDKALELSDRLVLVDAWLHDPLAIVGEAERDLLGKVAARYGVAFTTAGVRWGRSPADLVCARSSAKGPAAADVLASEVARRGDDLRALVVVERDRATTPPAAARRALGEDAGTAARVLAALCACPEIAQVGVIAVTGRGAWTSVMAGDGICAAVNVHGRGEQRWVSTEGCEIEGALRLVGHGRGWDPGQWLAAAEAAMDDGAARVLVATRALVGEGWDYPPLNVVVDLSEVASSTATTQLRGRALRLDPARPDKLASLWDVVVAHPAAPGDWQRLRRRHRHWWGPGFAGAVVTGPAKLHPLAGVADVPTSIEQINTDSALAMADADATRRAWAALDPSGVATAAVHVRSRRRRRVRTRTRRWRSLGAAAAISGVGGIGAGLAAVSTPALWPLAAAGALGAAALAGLARGRERGERETLEALAEAVLAGLIHAGDHDLAGACLSISADPAGGWVAAIDRADDDAAARWSDALAETLGPLGTPRWMVVAGDRTWRVPSAIGASRASAETFSRAFRSRVPAVELVRAGTPRATECVLAAARHRPDEVVRFLRWS